MRRSFDVLLASEVVPARLSLEGTSKSHYRSGSRSRSDLLVVSQPTRGLDVGAIEYILAAVQERDSLK